MRWLALVLGIALLAGCAPGPAMTVASPGASPSASAPATPTRPSLPSQSPSVSAGPINVTTAIGAIPRSFHYFDVGQGESFRILLFDEDSARPPIEVLRSGPIPAPAGPDVRPEAFTVSADGKVLVVMRRLSPQLTTYYALRPETGEFRALLSGADLGPPVITADGQLIAFARTSDDPAVNGLWLFGVAAGAPPPIRLVSDNPPNRVGSPPQPVAWSPDGTWLAIAPGVGDSGTVIAVIDPTSGEARFDGTTNTLVGGRARVLGPGYAVDWRGGERNLLVTSTRTLFGGRTEIYTADVTTGATRSLYRPNSDVVLGAATFHPVLDRYATTEHPIVGGLVAPTATWLRRLDGSGTKLAESRFLSLPWWSRDGAKLFAIAGGDDSNSGIVDLLGSSAGTRFCVRGGVPPACN